MPIPQNGMFFALTPALELTNCIPHRNYMKTTYRLGGFHVYCLSTHTHTCRTRKDTSAWCPFMFGIVSMSTAGHRARKDTRVGVVLCSTFTATHRTHKNTNTNTNTLVSLCVQHCLTLESSGAPHFDTRRWREAPSSFPSVLTLEGRGDPPPPPPPSFPSVSTPEGWGNPPPPPPSISMSEGGGGTTSSLIPPRFDARSPPPPPPPSNTNRHPRWCLLHEKTHALELGVLLCSALFLPPRMRAEDERHPCWCVLCLTTFPHAIMPGGTSQ